MELRQTSKLVPFYLYALHIKAVYPEMKYEGFPEAGASVARYWAWKLRKTPQKTADLQGTF
jgi:hypothetical protein